MAVDVHPALLPWRKAPARRHETMTRDQVTQGLRSELKRYELIDYHRETVG
jgi:hypothetical protein